MKERFERFTVLIAKISKSIRKIKNLAMAKYGLKSSHVSCLYYLRFSSAITATDLCDKCEDDKATISRSIDYLEKKGYLIRDNANSKRYKSPLKLTELGEKVADIIAEKVNQVINEVGGGLSEKERVDFYRSLAIVSSGLSAISNKMEEKA